MKYNWTSLAVQWLRLCTSNAGGTGLIPGQGTKICMPHGTVKKKKLTSSVTFILGVQHNDSVIDRWILFQILSPYRLLKILSIVPCWLSKLIAVDIRKSLIVLFLKILSTFN